MIAWLFNWARSGPLIASLVLSGLCVEELARAGRSMMASHRTESPSHAYRPSGAAGALDPGAIVNAHLFGISAAGTPGGDAVAPTTAFDLQLRGTIARTNPHRGYAILSTGGSDKLFHPGEDVGGAALHSVYVDHVLLDRGGQLQSLSLPRIAGAAGILEISASDSGVDAPRTGTPRRFSDVMSAEPKEDDDAKGIVGFRIAPIPPVDRLMRSGLRPYDVITAVNGAPVTTPNSEHESQTFDEAMASSSAMFTVIRSGRRMEILADILR